MNIMKVSTAPHIHAKDTVQTIMRDVIIALLPTAAVGVYYFGLRALTLILVSVATAVLSEFVWQKLAKKPVRIHDLSAVVTSLILALNLPSTAPWWVAVIGSVFAIIIVKQIFGGLGGNFLNPAMAARAVLLASFPARMTAFVLPNCISGTDAITSATYLSGNYTASTMDLFLGNIPGTIGEVCKVAIIIGFIYLLIRRVIKLTIPVFFIASAAVFCYLLNLISGGTSDPMFAVNSILSGGVMFGAVFMATDYTTNPMTFGGEIVFAVGCGLIVALIRIFGSYPEGVTYAILLMNIATPLIDKYMKPKLYGEVKQK